MPPGVNFGRGGGGRFGIDVGGLVCGKAATADGAEVALEATGAALSAAVAVGAALVTAGSPALGREFGAGRAVAAAGVVALAEGGDEVFAAAALDSGAGA